MHAVQPQPTIEVGGGDLLVLLSIRELPRQCRPCHLRQRPGVTLLTIDPRHTRFEVSSWIVANLSERECEAYRAAYGLPPIGSPGPEWVADDGPCLLYVPPSLRTAGAAPLQGGRELRRRRALGQLEMEIAAYLLEDSVFAPQGA